MGQDRAFSKSELSNTEQISSIVGCMVVSLTSSIFLVEKNLQHAVYIAMNYNSVIIFTAISAGLGSNTLFSLQT